MQGNKATTLWATARANLIGINLGVLRKYIAYCLLEQSNSKNQWHAYLHNRLYLQKMLLEADVQCFYYL